MGNSTILLTVDWPEPRDAFLEAKGFALPKVFEFAGVLSTLVITVMIIRSLRR